MTRCGWPSTFSTLKPVTIWKIVLSLTVLPTEVSSYFSKTDLVWHLGLANLYLPNIENVIIDEFEIYKGPDLENIVINLFEVSLNILKGVKKSSLKFKI